MTANNMPPIPPIGPTTGVAMPPTASRFKPIDPLRVVRQNLHWLIFAGIISVLLGVGAWAVLLYTYPRYSSEAQLKVSPPLENAMDLSQGSAVQIAQMEPLIMNEVNRLVSDEVLREAIRSPLVRETAWYKGFESETGAVNEEKVIDDLLEHYYSVHNIRGSTLINVRVTTGTDENDEPMKILQAVLDSYEARMRGDIRTDSEKARRDLLDERDRINREIEALKRNLEDFVRQNRITAIDARMSDAQIQLNNYLTKQIELQFELKEAEEMLSGYVAQQEQGGMQPTAEEILAAQGSNEVIQITNSITMLTEQYDANVDQYGPNHRLVKQLERRIDSLKRQKKNMVDEKVRQYQTMKVDSARMQVEALRSQVEDLQPAVEEINARLTDMQAILEQYSQLQEELEAAVTRKNEIETLINEVRVMVQRGIVPVTRYGGPTMPEMTFPKVEIVAPGVAFLVFAMVLGLIFLRELMDQYVRTPADVKLLAHGELLAVIPSSDEDPSGRRDVERVVERYPTGLMAESFRQLRSALSNKMDRRGYKTLLCVSPQPECGTSCVLQNLAASYAFNGRRVLVIDANFRRPAQARLMGVGNDVGLAELLQGQASCEEAVVPVEGTSLALLPAGVSGEARPELLDSPALRSLLAKAEAEYDLILIDAPPALLSSEAQLLAKQVDAIAVVARADADKRGMLDRMLGQLDGQRADVLGVILNGVRSSAGGYFRKSYQQFYRYQQGANGASRARRVASVDRVQIPADVEDKD